MAESESSYSAGSADSSITYELLNKLINVTQDSIALLDNNGRILKVNRSGAHLLGSTPDQLIGKSLYDLFPPELALSRKTKIDEVVKTGKPTTFDDYRNGIYWQNFVYPITNESGIVTVVAILASDITERKQMEKELISQVQKYRTLIESMPDFIARFDKEARHLYVNPSVTRAFGMPLEHFVGKTLKEISGTGEPEQTEILISKVKEVFEHGTPNMAEACWMAQDGERFIEIRHIPELDHQGKVVSVLGLTSDITERKKIEEELRKNQKRYEKAQSIGHVGNWEYDHVTTKFWGSAEAKRIYGFDFESDDFTSEMVENCIPELERVHQALVDLIEHDKNYDLEFDIITYDKGIRKTIHSVAEAERDKKGNLLKVNGVITDITEHKKIETALQESEKKHTKYIEHAPLGIFVTDSNGHYVDVNPGGCALTGYSRDELLNLSISDLSTAEDGLNSFLQLKQNGTLGVEGKLRRKDGTIVYVSIEAVTLSYDLFMAFCTDITKRKSVEEALRESEKRFSTIFKYSPIPVALTRYKDDKLSDVNQAWLNLTGFSKEEVIGKSTLELRIYVNPDQKTEISREIQSQGRVDSFEMQMRKKSGEVAILLLSADAIELEGELYVLSMALDVSETKRLQEQKSRAERLETAGTIAGQVAHDFNNLLAPLIAYPDFIREELSEDNPALGYLDQIEMAAQKIADINQQLLTLGRRGHYNQDVLNLNAIVNQAVKNMAWPTENVTCETNLDPNLLNILGGGSQIHRVIINLLCNAVDAMQDIGHIYIRTENYYADDVSSAFGRVPKGEYVKLTISDNGCGISDDIVQKILDPFFSTKTTDKKRGSGLGLSVVDAVIKDHKGFLDLKTQPGKGTSFYIYFPTTRKLAYESDSDETCGGSEKILVVDDDEIQREVSTQLLERLGYEVNQIESGEEAIEFLRETPHDLVILDMIMPGGIDGAETYRRILEVNPKQKAVIVSGFSESERVKVAQELGVGNFIKKPLTKKAIAVAVRAELDRKVIDFAN